MKKLLTSLSLSLLLVFQAANIFAGELRTVTLIVDGMTCGTCPITVKKALRKVDGLTEVIAKYERKGDGWAKVSFDASKTDVDDLIFATQEAGYPSRLKP
ncbi:MAG: mercuric transport protein periplasmic component [Gammaproteobacteria bacterium]|nr:cation transporter [Gammaproteobacteria bacterium]PCH64080.1 MAG: mercuric transport protein periplasmic component [Gammaproteobacteria bacterium]